jgi:hypothetical protein
MIKHLFLFCILGSISTKNNSMTLLKDLKDKKGGLEYMIYQNRPLLYFNGIGSLAMSAFLAYFTHRILSTPSIVITCDTAYLAISLYMMGWEGHRFKTQRQNERNFYFSIAAQNGRLGTMQLLYANGVQINEELVDDPGNGIYKEELICPLYAALSKNQIDAADFLKENGADINLRLGENKETILMLLAQANKNINAKPGMRWLLHEGANLHQEDTSGRTALDLATTADRKLLLLEAKRNVPGR